MSLDYLKEMREVRKDKKQARKTQNAEENHYDNIFQQNKIETDKKFKDKRKHDVSHILAMFLRLSCNVFAFVLYVFYLFFCPMRCCLPLP